MTFIFIFGYYEKIKNMNIHLQTPDLFANWSFTFVNLLLLTKNSAINENILIFLFLYLTEQNIGWVITKILQSKLLISKT